MLRKTLNSKEINDSLLEDKINEVDMIYLSDIQPEKWTLLIFSHKPSSFLSKSEFLLIKDNEHIVNNIDYPNMKSQKIISIGFFKDFTGQSSTVMMSTETISSNAIFNEIKHFNFGLYNEKNIRLFKDLIENDNNSLNSVTKIHTEFKNFLENLLLIYSPSRYNENKIRDVIDNIDSDINLTIENNIRVGGIALNTNSQTNISFLGGFNILIPILDFFANNTLINSTLVCELLDLIYRILENGELNIKNCIEQKFFKFMQILFEAFNQTIFNTDVIDKLIDLANLLTNNQTDEKILKHFYKFILFNPKLISKFEMNMQVEYWRKISQIYYEHVTILNKIISAKKIISIILKFYDNDINIYCCYEHSKMLCEKFHFISNENNSCPNNSIENNDKKEISDYNNLISSPNLIYKLSPLLNIIEIIFTNNKIIAIDQLKTIIPFLSCEFSPCIQKSLILIFLKIFSAEYLNSNNVFNIGSIGQSSSLPNNLNPNHQFAVSFDNSNVNLNFNVFNNYDDYFCVKKDPRYFIDDSIRTKYISVFLKNKGLEHILAISSISTLDVRVECIKIFDIFSRFSSILPYNMEDQLIPFLASSIFPLKTPLNDSMDLEKNNMNLIENTSNLLYMSDSKILQKSSTYENITSKNKWIISEIGEDNNEKFSESSGRKSLVALDEVDNETTTKKFDFKVDLSNITPIQKGDKSPYLDSNVKLENFKLTNKNEFDFYELANNTQNTNLNSNNSNFIKSLKRPGRENNNIPKNSLNILEDEYFRMIIESSFISSLKIPVNYVKFYSNELNDFYLEKLYDYLVKWLVDRYEDEESKLKNSNLILKSTIIPSNSVNKNLRTEVSDDIHLDDSDCIKFRYTLNIIMKLIMNSNIMSKQKCLIDFYMLSIYNRDNSVIFLSNKYFYQWLLDLLLPYQILIINEKFKQSKQSGIAFTILDLGAKIHTSIIINSILNDKKYQNETFILKSFNFILVWMYKIKILGTNEGEGASYLVRNIIFHLIKTMSENLRLMSPSVNAPMWHYFLNLTFTTYEFIFYSNFYKKILDKNIIFDHLEKNEIFAEIIQNLNYDMKQEKSRRNSTGNISMIDLWLDKELVVELYKCYKVIWNQINFKIVITEKQSFFTFKNLTGILNEENQKFREQTYSYNTEEIKNTDMKIQKLIFETSPNYYWEDLKLFMFHAYNMGTLQTEKNPKNNLMRIILNILIILIMLSENFSDIQNWIDELEKFVSFIVIATENARYDSQNPNMNDAFLLNQQDCTAELLVLVIYFLIDEINSPRRKKNSDQIINIFKNSLKFVFTHVCLIFEKIDIINKEEMKKKESMLTSYFKSFKNVFYTSNKSLKFFSPSYKLFSEMLMNSSKNKLIDINDIQNWKSNNFKGIIELFNEENWIFAFQENNITFEIIKNQFQFNHYEKMINFKLLEAQDIVINNEIGIKEKAYVNQLYRCISNSIRDSLSFVEKFLKNEIFKMFFKKKRIEYKIYKIKKNLFLFRGAWSDYNFYGINHNNINNINSCNEESNEIESDLSFYKYKVSNHISGSLSRNVLYPIYDLKKYLPNFTKYAPSNLFIDEEINKKITEKNNNFGVLEYNRIYYDLDESLENKVKNLNIEQTIKKNKMEEKKREGFCDMSILKIKQITNKSNIFYKNSQFSDFIDKYADIEKLLKFYKIYFERDFNLIIINIVEHFVNKIKSENPESVVFEACIVKISGHKKGKLIINKKNIIFIKNNFDIFQSELDEEKCFDSLFKSKIILGQKLIIKIPIKSVKQIYKRRLYYKNNSLEIFLFKNRSYYFRLPSQIERDQFCKLSYDYCCQKFNPFLFEFHIDIKRNLNLLNKVSEEWIYWRMSNFDFLMNLNNMGGRSFHDLTQYPVFPWVISNYTTETFNLKTLNNNNLDQYLRDLTKPIGALGSEDRIEAFCLNFKESCLNYDNIINSMNNNQKIEFNEGKYFYNSHYSNPFYVCNFLARIFPFTYSTIELQGDSFDNPNRQFLSIPKAFKNCMSQSTDLRELTPEFFYLPEFLMNKNKINFGRITELENTDLDNNLNQMENENSDKSDNYPNSSKYSNLKNKRKNAKNIKNREFIENVDLPLWSRDPCFFIYINKTILESQFVSNKINKWIDLIFGYKQKGKEAENCMNLFWNHTYEDEIDIDFIKKEDFDEYMSYISKLEFGQTPSQLFTKPLVQRLKKELTKSKMFLENKKSMKNFRSTAEPSNHFRNRKETVKKMIIKIKSLEDNKLICVFNNGVVSLMKLIDTPFSESRFTFINEKELVIKKSKHLGNEEHSRFILDEDYTIMRDIYQNQPVKITSDGNYIFSGGFWSGKFSIFSVQKEEIIYFLTDEFSKVTFIEFSDCEKFIFIGTSSGRIYIYHIEEEIISSSPIKSYFFDFGNLNLIKIIKDHETKINWIFFCKKMHIFATVADDKSCNLYTFPDMKNYNIIKNSKFSYDYVFISSSPLPSVILYSKSELCFFCYTVNGTLIQSEKDGVKNLFSPLISNDNSFNDVLFYGTDNGCLILRSLPYLKPCDTIILVNNKDNISEIPIKVFDISIDKRSIFYWELDNFKISVIRDPRESKKKTKDGKTFEDDLTKEINQNNLFQNTTKK